MSKSISRSMKLFERIERRDGAYFLSMNSQMNVNLFLKR